jgi:hypothetical protein
MMIIKMRKVIGLSFKDKTNESNAKSFNLIQRANANISLERIEWIVSYLEKPVILFRATKKIALRRYYQRMVSKSF